MVELRIFDPPVADSPQFVARGRATAATDITLVERLYTPGYFTASIPAQARHADQLREGRLLLADGAFWGIVDAVSAKADASGDVLTVTGRQLKGLTQDRVTIPPGTTAVTGAQGYDTVNGSTETCVKHFVDGNLGPGAAAARQVFGLELAGDRGRGVADDKYMSRHQPLADVLSALGEASGLGYDIVPDLARHKLVFDVVEGEDHTGGQSERVRVVFSLARKTALSQEYQHSGADAKNLFYTTMDGSEFADETLTVTYTRDGEAEPVGIRRKETHLALSADTPTAGDEYNELRRLAMIQAEELRPAESFTCEIPAAGRYLYRRDYGLGDRVTVQNLTWGVSMDARLTEMQSRYSAQGVSLTATFGKAPLNIFGRIERQIKGA